MADGYNTQSSVYQDLFSLAKLHNLMDGYAPIQSNVLVENRIVDMGNLLDVFIGSDNAYSYTQYFKLRGFNAGTNEYETWTSANLPNLNPPSGNSLTDIVIVEFWFA